MDNKVTEERAKQYCYDNSVCGFCMLADECPKGMACYGGDPVEPPCVNMDDDFIDRNVDMESIMEMLQEQE